MEVVLVKKFNYETALKIERMRVTTKILNEIINNKEIESEVIWGLVGRDDLFKNGFINGLLNPSKQPGEDVNVLSDRAVHLLEWIKVGRRIVIHVMNHNPLQEVEKKFLKDCFPILCNVFLNEDGLNTPLIAASFCAKITENEQTYDLYLKEVESMMLLSKRQMLNGKEHLIRILTINSPDLAARVYKYLLNKYEMFNENLFCGLLALSNLAKNPKFIDILCDDVDLFVDKLNNPEPFESNNNESKMIFCLKSRDVFFSSLSGESIGKLFPKMVKTISSIKSENIHPMLISFFTNLLVIPRFYNLRVESKIMLKIPLNDDFLNGLNSIFAINEDRVSFKKNINIAYLELGLHRPFDYINPPGFNAIYRCGNSVFIDEFPNQAFTTFKNAWLQMSNVAKNNLCFNFLVSVLKNCPSNQETCKFFTESIYKELIDRNCHIVGISKLAIKYYCQLITEDTSVCFHPFDLSDFKLHAGVESNVEIEEYIDVFYLLETLKNRKCNLAVETQKYLAINLLTEQKTHLLNLLFNGEIDTLRNLVSDIKICECEKIELRSDGQSSLYLLGLIDLYLETNEIKTQESIEKLLKEVNECNITRDCYPSRIKPTFNLGRGYSSYDMEKQNMYNNPEIIFIK